MWIVTLISSLKIEEGFGIVQTIGWFPSVRNAEDFISENRKNLQINPMFRYAILERYKVNTPTKLISRVFPHFVTWHEVFRFDDEKNTFVRDKRLDCKIPQNYWIAFRRSYPDHNEFREEEIRK